MVPGRAVSQLMVTLLLLINTIIFLFHLLRGLFRWLLEMQGSEENGKAIKDLLRKLFLKVKKSSYTNKSGPVAHICNP
jgi:hypothetical protein